MACIMQKNLGSGKSVFYKGRQESYERRWGIRRWSVPLEGPDRDGGHEFCQICGWGFGFGVGRSRPGDRAGTHGVAQRGRISAWPGGGMTRARSRGWICSVGPVIGAMWWCGAATTRSARPLSWTGEPIATERRSVAADNTLYHNSLRASHIILPVIPAK